MEWKLNKFNSLGSVLKFERLMIGTIGTAQSVQILSQIHKFAELAQLPMKCMGLVTYRLFNVASPYDNVDRPSSLCI